MNANELRIGNFIYNIGDALTFVDVDIIHDINIQSESRPRYYAIPLTEEWFLRLGLKQLLYNDCINTGEYKFNKWVVINFVDDDSGCSQLCLSGRYLPTHFNYVHQLQNIIFDLTQKELTIKS